MVDLDAFAKDWIDAFNARDMDRILSHYTDDVRLYSPRVKATLGGDASCVEGKEALRHYFTTGLAHSPELRFTLDRVYPGEGSVVLRIRANEGREGSEMMVFAGNGLVREVRAHWTAALSSPACGGGGAERSDATEGGSP
jgi:hypothetical protein